MAEEGQLIRCPEEGCPYAAEVTRHYYSNGAPIPVEMVRLECFGGHWFEGAADGFGIEERIGQ